MKILTIFTSMLFTGNLLAGQVLLTCDGYEKAGLEVVQEGAQTKIKIHDEKVIEDLEEQLSRYANSPNYGISAIYQAVSMNARPVVIETLGADDGFRSSLAYMTTVTLIKGANNANHLKFNASYLQYPVSNSMVEVADWYFSSCY